MPPRATLMIRMPGFALARKLVADQADGLGRLGHVQGDEVGLRGQRVEVDQIDVHLPGPLGGDERVVGDEPHPERHGPLRDELADATEADDAERLVGELDALPLRPLPPAGDERGVGLRHVAGLGQQQRHGLLGGREDVRLRGVDDHHALAGGRLDVDVVETDAGPPDDARGRCPASSTSAVTVVAERMIRAWAPLTAVEQLLWGEAEGARRRRGRRRAAGRVLPRRSSR